MAEADIEQQLAERVRDAGTTPFQIVGGNSKAFYGRAGEGDRLDVGGHHGITAYDPRELVLTARAGTPLREIEQVLAEAGQGLPFEPPHFGESATLGGTIACGFSGPARPYVGSARDYVLGCRIINGRGEILSFGGQVMKNVAGYDVSRLMVGALGTLGVLLEISLKVLPVAQATRTLLLPLEQRPALDLLQSLGGRPLPISGAVHWDNRLHLRLTGNTAAVETAVAEIGGDLMTENAAAEFWTAIREHRHAFFNEEPHWRLSLPPEADSPPGTGPGLIDWGGAQRWLTGEQDGDALRGWCQATGGHATLFRGGPRDGVVFQPLNDALRQLHRQIKQAFDPAGILNRGRLYPDW